MTKVNEYHIDTPPTDDDYAINKAVAGDQNEIIRKQGDEYCLKSHKGKNLGCYPSKGSAEHREKQVQYFKHQNEMTGMAAGNVAGANNKSPFKKPFKRQDLHEEIVLEKLVRESIDNFLLEQFQVFKSKKLNEIKLSNSIRKLVLREKKEIEDDPHASTGINILEELLKKIVPDIEEGYKSLTTNKEQRDSFSAHLLKAIQQTLDTSNLNQQASAISVDESVIQDDISVSVDPEKDEKYLDIDKKKPGDDEEVDTFSIAGENETGRNMAKATFDRIEKQITDAYSILSDPEDKQLFYEYLIANVRLHMSKFENELSGTATEPEVGKDIEANADTGGGSDLGLGV